jgi:hypothetical protein
MGQYRKSANGALNKGAIRKKEFPANAASEFGGYGKKPEVGNDQEAGKLYLQIRPLTVGKKWPETVRVYYPAASVPDHKPIDN